MGWAFDRVEQMGENPIHLLLDAIGVPWQSSRVSLAERYGVRQHPAYRWDVIEIPTRPPIVAGMLWPLSAPVTPQFSPSLPAIEFSAVTSGGDDARDNLRATVAQITPLLGAPAIADSTNTLARRWAFGAASLTLMVWPPELQRQRTINPAHDRDTRLKSGCHMAIKTGWRKPATVQELGWLNRFVPIARIPLSQRKAADAIGAAPAAPQELEFVRAPVADLADIFGFIGISADHAALIFCHTQLYLVAMDDVIGFHVQRTLPAKGGGGSQLYVECRTDYHGLATKRLLISAADDPEGSNDLSAALSTATGKTFELGDYVYDD